MERNVDQLVASPTPPTGDLAHNLGMCPDWELNHQPWVCRLVLNPLSHSSQSWTTLKILTAPWRLVSHCIFGEINNWEEEGGFSRSQSR